MTSYNYYRQKGCPRVFNTSVPHPGQRLLSPAQQDAMMLHAVSQLFGNATTRTAYDLSGKAENPTLGSPYRPPLVHQNDMIQCHASATSQYANTTEGSTDASKAQDIHLKVFNQANK